MWLNLVFFIAFCGQAISESPGLRTMYMISVFIGVYMFVAHNTPGWFPTGAGSRSLPPMTKVALLMLMFTASGRMNLYEGKGFSRAGVCNWLPLYYHAGMYRVPLCYIAVNCDKE